MQTAENSQVPLAVIGIGCRFPGGVVDPNSFWNLLSEGRSGVVEVPEERWNRERYYHADRSIPGRMITKWGGFLGRPDLFDPQFWGISPREAKRMDPQQRWLLEVAWEAIEDAGIAPMKLRGRPVGVFVGVAGNDYAGLQMPNYAGTDVHTNSGCTLSIASNRISYLLDLKGPSVSIDTACSSALVAMSQACHSIWSGDCEAVLAGGVNAILTPHATIGFSKASMLSPSGQCFAFDERANGYVRGEGAAMVLIKPISDAQRDGDPTYAVIRSAVVNSDGHTSSMTVPGVEGQSAMLEQAYRDAGIPPSHVTYMEAHGTGTPVGDPIEATALGNVLSQGRPDDRRCLVGSVKTNIGHLESGSGIAGFVKAALVLHHDTVPPSLNFSTPNPDIPFDSLGLRVADQLQPLPHLPGIPPVTGVNSFGFGGTNAHVVLEAAPSPSVQTANPAATIDGCQQRADRPYVLPISARDETALESYLTRYRKRLQEVTSETELADFCCSAGTRKEHHDSRLTVIGKDVGELRRRLMQAVNDVSAAEGIVRGRAADSTGSLVFVFTGQGAQWWKMGRELYHAEPVFHDVIQQIDSLLRPLAGWSLVDEMMLPTGEDESGIHHTNIAQPAIFALQVALVELWNSWGVRPTTVIGHSVGEVAAAYAAGIYSLKDAVCVIYHRSRLQDSAGGDGRMAAAGISPAEAQEIVKEYPEQLHVAVINSPGMVTLAGDREPLESVVARLEAEGKFVRMLRINYAFHTHHMDPIQDELLDVLAQIEPQPAKIPFISTVTGSMLAGEKLDASYWWRNVRQPVLFSSAISNLVRAGERSFLEVGPHPALESSIADVLNEQRRQGHVYHSLKRKTPESQQMLTNLSRLHVDGRPIDWAAVNQSGGQFVRLPKYPWTYDSYWLESDQSARERLDPVPHPLLGQRVPAEKPTWTFQLDPRLFAFLSDHQIWDSIVFPGAGYGEIGLAIARELFPDQPYVVEDLEIAKALFVSEERIPTVRVTFDEDDAAFTVCSTTGNDAWEVNSRGRLIEMPAACPDTVDLDAIRRSLPDCWTHEEYYDDFDAAGYQFGPNFKHITTVWREFGEVLAEISVPADISATVPQYRIHPAVLDACFHVFKGLKTSGDPRENFFLPASARRIRLYVEQPDGRLWAHARMIRDEPDSVISDICVYNDLGQPVGEILGFRVDRMDQAGSDTELNEIYFQQSWQPAKLKGSRVQGSCKFAAPLTVVRHLQPLTNEVYERLRLEDYYHDFTPRLESVVRQAIQNAYIQLGWQPQIDDTFTHAEICAKLGIARQHHRLIQAQLRALSADGILESAGNAGWKVLRQPSRTAIDDQLDELERQYPRLTSEVRLQRLTCDALAGVLCGEIDSVKLLFPDGGSKLLDTYYVDAFDFPAYMELIPAAVARVVKQLPKRRSLRILEVGSGTGSLTGAVLPILPTQQSEYLFTDVTSAFLASARQQFADYSFVDYATFDIERDPAEQGIEPGSFDLILATNVIHATKDVRSSLRNLKSCLAPGGLLMFQEVVRPRITLDNIFGLLQGWWHYTDTDLRTSTALLPREEWLRILQDGGFAASECFHCSPDSDEAEQSVFVASVPGPQAAESPNESATNTTAPAHVILSDQSGIGDELSAQLRSAGHRVVVATAGDAFEPSDSGQWVIRPTAEEDYRALLEAAGDVSDVIHCWSLDHPDPETMSVKDLEHSQQSGVLSALFLSKALTQRAFDAAPRVRMVTRGVNAVRPEESICGVASSSLHGLARVANNEHPEFQWTTIDFDGVQDGNEVHDLMDEIRLNDEEFEIAYRDGIRFANRIASALPDDLPYRTTNAVQPDADIIPWRLETGKAGILTNLSLNETQRRKPGPGEVEVLVKAGGINFRDVMKALAMYPGNPIDVLWFGDDFSGTVVRVGEAVTDISVGDDVAGMAPYSFRAYNTVDRRMLFPKPAHLSFEEAATLSTVFLTTHYAINHLARMQEGEKILIHAGTGGVGQAAIQISQHLGLEIFATAGTPEKRQMLKDMGVPHVMDSRSLDFADEIMAITSGSGVDAVLNSLAGEFIPKSFSVLAPFGRFLEIGKIDIYNNTRLGLEQLRNNISYFVIDLAQHLEQKPDFIASMFADLANRFEQRDYRPLSYRAFPIPDVVEAFRYMAQGKHVGKNVLSFDVEDIPVGPCTEDEHIFSPEATWLIVGGAGGFGLEIAKWMTNHGARHIALMSRSGPRDEDAANAVADLQKAGFHIADVRGDVTCREDVRAVIQQIQTEMPPLSGVIHGAMVLDDEFMAELNVERFSRVLNPKILGAWNLHQETADLPLKHFICFSSMSCIIGAARQSNYNAGNIFLDCLAHYRRSLGLPAQTINWGSLSGAGFVERNEKTALYLDKLGMSSLSMEEALTAFRRVIARDCGQIVASRADWEAFARVSPFVATSPTFRPMLRSVSDSEGGGAIRPRLLAAPSAERLKILQDFVAEQVGGVFGVEPDQVDRETSLTNLGLDSLMAIDLINRIETELGMSVPMGNVLRGPSLNELAEGLVDLFAADDLSEGDDAAATSATTTSLAPVQKSNLYKDEFPLTEGQQALWFLYRLAPDSSAYNLTFSGRFTPHVDIDAMEKAFRLLYRRHPMLDVTFSDDTGQPVQRLRRDGAVDFCEYDAASLSPQQLHDRLVEQCNRPFDLENGPVIRLALFRTDAGHIGLMSIHHIISDAWSVTVLMRDLIEAYFTIRAGREPQLSEIPLQFSDFVAWEEDHLQSDAGRTMGQFWQQHIDGAPHVIDLPTDRPRPAVQSFRGATHGFKLDEDAAYQVLQTAAHHNVTLFTLLLAAYDVLIHRYTGQQDVLVGVPMAGRQQADLHDLVGYFVNPVPMRSRVDDDPTFEEVLRRTQEAVTTGLENQQYPLKRIVHDAGVQRDTSRSPLFQVAFSMERIPGFNGQEIAVFLIGEGGHRFHFGDLQMESIELNTRQSQFEILLVIEEAGGSVYGCWQYNRDLFDAATIEKLHRQFVSLLDQISADSARRVSEYAVTAAPGAESTRQPQAALMAAQVEKWNATDRALTDDLLVHQRFEHQAATTPDRVAVECNGRQLTYRELNERANQLAAFLTDSGVQAGDRVGICLDRCPDLMVAIYGVVKSGAAYVPLDPDYPESRLKTISDSAGMRLVVTHAEHRQQLNKCGDAVLLDSQWAEIATRSTQNPNASVGRNDLIYVIYTSGSTGQPKGAGVYHRGFVNLVDWFTREFAITPDDSSLIVTSHGFDLTQKNLFAPLTAGARVLLSSARSFDPDIVLREVGDADVTLLNCTPSHMYMLVADGRPEYLAMLSSLRCVWLGGEPIDMSRLADWRSQPDFATELVNTYGPTECTDISSFYRVPAESNETTVPIGYPVSNVRTYVLDDELRQLDVGKTGELYIAGAGVGAGYINDADMTESRFVADPFAGDSGRLYRTGDLCRYRSDGAIEFAGRKDEQVKVRGFRIELGEIECVLRQHSGIKETVVATKLTPQQNQQLVAYCVNSNGNVTADELRSHLTEYLPDHMVPSQFVTLNRIPLNAHGKVDRLALPEPVWDETATKTQAPEAPLNETEHKLVSIWQDVLGLNQISTRDGFFDLGGDSMQSVELMIRIRKTFDVEIPLAVLLQRNTISEIAVWLSQNLSAEWSAVVPIQPHGDRPPLFCVHPIGGNVLCYSKLATCFGTDQPVYGIQARGVDKSTEPVESLDAMVDEYVREVTELQPCGSIHLAAWSSGGVIAYEMARRLRQQGRDIAWVALFDSYAPRLLQVDSEDDTTVLMELLSFLNRFYGLNVAVDEQRLRSLDTTERLTLVRETLQESGFVSSEIDIDYLRRFLSLCQATLRAISSYDAPSENISTLLFRASDPVGRSYAISAEFEDDLGWNLVVGDALRIIPVDGNHVTLLTGESAQSIADCLTPLMQIDESAAVG